MLVLLILGLLLLIWLYRLTHKNDPLDIAKQRFAKGEISREEFDEIQARLIRRKIQ